ncbi:DUF4234 domain-containing protein [Kluyvera ascorbata]|uniref:DUF4234 domain-containing protein n=1 Tax=Kluyvera ascorbata TaxID=51288 RepID=UPI000E015FF4|nr:DUF4234 domain-containing protein [Kluyvera ascorbata]BCA38782.1 hypothetical protein KATP_13040 [Kluyvera ascorbata]STW98032.1 Uncharacterised protein [Kluyvera ascorbata]HBL0735498.1 DUF4234 domain-containing protein [Kluyvera ascorbata]
MESQDIASLKNKLASPTWHLVLLSIASYGIYPLMWLYRNQDTIMQETGHRFSSRVLIIWMAVCAGLSLALKLLFPMPADDYYGYGPDDTTMTFYGIATLISIAWIVLMIVWAFKARAALQHYALTQFRFELKMNPVWTVLFHVFYINYCINSMPEALAKHLIIYGKTQQPVDAKTE